MDIRSLSTWAFAALVCGGAAGELLPLAAGAQPDHDLIAGLEACAALQRAEARLDCYDELARRAHASPSAARSATTEPPQPAATATPPNETTPAAAQPAPPRSEAPPTARAPSEAEFGLAPPATERGSTLSTTELVSRVAALRELQPGRLEITLVNGQVWRQTNSDRYALEVGHEVRIYSTRFGSYFRLSATELRSFVQVERVR